MLLSNSKFPIIIMTTTIIIITIIKLLNCYFKSENKLFIIRYPCVPKPTVSCDSRLEKLFAPQHYKFNTIQKYLPCRLHWYKFLQNPLGITKDIAFDSSASSSWRSVFITSVNNKKTLVSLQNLSLLSTAKLQSLKTTCLSDYNDINRPGTLKRQKGPP